MTDTIHATGEITGTIPRIVNAAIAVAAGRMRLGSQEEARSRLRKDDALAVGYFRFEMARQIATLLLRADELVLAVYEEQDVPESEELPAPPVSLRDPLRLYVLVERDTAALRSLIAALDRALAEALAAHVDAQIASVLDALVVEAREAGRLGPRALGFRPAPALLVSRQSLQQDEGRSGPGPAR